MYKVLIEDMIINNISTDINTPRCTGTIKQGINCIDSFQMKLLANNPCFFNDIKYLKTRVKVINSKTNEVEFGGRVLTGGKQMSENGLLSKTYVCESCLAYLQDSSQTHGEYHNMTVREYLELLINIHNSQVDDFKKFEVGQVTVTDPNNSIYRYTSYESTYNNIKSDLLDKLGGELQVREVDGKLYLDYLIEIGTEGKTVLKLGKNIKSFSENIDPTEFGTRIIPLGAKLKTKNAEGNEVDSEERLTIASVNNNCIWLDNTDAIKEFGTITKQIFFDDVTDANNLKKKAEDYILKSTIKVSNNISALDLYSIGLDPDNYKTGNYYKVDLPILGIDYKLRIVEKSIDIESPQNTNLIVGDRNYDIKSYTLNNKKSLEKSLDAANKKIKELENIINSNKVVEVIPGDENDVEIVDPQEPTVDEPNLDDGVDGIPNPDIPEEEEDKDNTGNNVVGPTDTIKNVSLTLKSKKIYNYGVLTYLKILLPSNIKVGYKSSITFTTPTGVKPFRFYQSSILNLSGDDCSYGALIPRPNTEYIINIEYGNKNRYVGNVNATRDSGYYTYKSFKGANDVVNIAKDYIKNKSLFRYAHKTIFTEGIKDNEWVENGKNNIDCSTGTGLWYRGRKYKNSKYFKSTFGNGARTDLYSWVFSLPRTAAEQAKYCIEQGWYLTDYGKNYNKCKKGDLIFWSDRPTSTSQSVLAKRFMRISHVAIIGGVDADGDIITYEVTSSSNVIQSRKLKNQPGKVVLIARPGQ